MPFQSGNKEGSKRGKDKPFRDALRMAIAELDDNHQGLRRLAAALVSKGLTGDVPALKEIAERLDGKVPQAIVGDDEHPPLVGYAAASRYIRGTHCTGHTEAVDSVIATTSRRCLH